MVHEVNPHLTEAVLTISTGFTEKTRRRDLADRNHQQFMETIRQEIIADKNRLKEAVEKFLVSIEDEIFQKFLQAHSTRLIDKAVSIILGVEPSCFFLGADPQIAVNNYETVRPYLAVLLEPFKVEIKIHEHDGKHWLKLSKLVPP